jgi:hypothetical protein
MTTRCKLTIESLNETNGEVQMFARAVYSPDSESENARFFSATPYGELRLGVVRKESLGDLAVGDEIYLDISKAPKT